MQKARSITVAVSPELYRQTRRIATEWDTSVTDVVRFLLLILPDALREARFSGARPQCAAARSRGDQPAKMSAQTRTNSPQEPQNELQKPVCIPVKRN